MFSFKKFKRFTALFLAVEIVLSGICFVFDTRKIQLGETVEAAADTWVQKSDGPTARSGSGHSAVEIDGKMYVYGGWAMWGTGKGITNELWVYDPVSDTWTQKASGELRLTGHVATAINGKMYVYGGLRAYNDYSDTVYQDGLYEYNPQTDSWRKINDGPADITAAQAITVDNKMYILGGYSTYNFVSIYTDIIYIYDPTTNTWSTKNYYTEGVANYSVVSMNNKVYKYGGANNGYFHQLQIYDFINNKQSSYSSPYYSSGQLAGVIKEKMYLFNVRMNDKVTIYSPTTNTWEETSMIPDGAAEASTAVTINNKIYLYGTGGLWEYSNNFIPTLSVSVPSQNASFSETDSSYIPQISVSDTENEVLSCKYYIDSKTTPEDIKTISNTSTSQSVIFNPVYISTLSEGIHTIKFEVSDGFDAPVTQTVNFKVDKSAPTFGAVTGSSTTNTITLSGSATDSIAGLDASPYRYTIGSEVSQ